MTGDLFNLLGEQVFALDSEFATNAVVMECTRPTIRDHIESGEVSAGIAAVSGALHGRDLTHPCEAYTRSVTNSGAVRYFNEASQHRSRSTRIN